MYRFGKEEVENVTRVVQSGSWFRYYGKEKHCNAVQELERRLADYTQAKHVLATSSGTGALCCALAALGVGPQDEVLVPGYTFIATPAAAISLGAVPVIVEIDETLTLDARDLERKISPRSKAIVPVHMLGHPCNMDAINAVARKHGLKVLEDSAQAVGAHYKGRALGTVGDIGIFSLQWHKIVSTGEGGAVLTNDPSLYERAAIYHDDAHCFRGVDKGIPAFPGVNYRMSEIAGSVGCAQIERLPKLIADLRAAKCKIVSAFGDLGQFRVARSNDPEGDAGTVITLQAPDEKSAAAFGERTGMNSILRNKATDWHIYYHWDYILEKRSVNGKGWPWKLGDWESPVKYSKDMCPQTLDVLHRSFNVGVNPDAKDADIATLRDKIRGGIAAAAEHAQVAK
jgi:dTDP-4-amino-4,6-dideoxygalactose transaminase